jgi:hypothetical protein
VCACVSVSVGVRACLRARVPACGYHLSEIPQLSLSLVLAAGRSYSGVRESERGKVSEPCRRMERGCSVVDEHDTLSSNGMRWENLEVFQLII